MLSSHCTARISYVKKKIRSTAVEEFVTFCGTRWNSRWLNLMHVVSNDGLSTNLHVLKRAFNWGRCLLRLADLMCWVLKILIFSSFWTMISCWQHVFVVPSGHFVFNYCRMQFTLHFVAFDLSYDIDTILKFRVNLYRIWPKNI